MVSDGARPGMLLNILHCAGQLPATKNYPAPNVSRDKAGNPAEMLYLDGVSAFQWLGKWERLRETDYEEGCARGHVNMGSRMTWRCEPANAYSECLLCARL